MTVVYLKEVLVVENSKLETLFCLSSQTSDDFPAHVSCGASPGYTVYCNWGNDIAEEIAEDQCEMEPNIQSVSQ